MSIGQTKTATAPKNDASKPAPKGKAKEKRFAGEFEEPREKMPHAGEYRFCVDRIEEGYNEEKDTKSFKAYLRIVDLDGDEARANHKVGEIVMIPWVVEGSKSAKRNRGRVKAFVARAAGYDANEEYVEFDPDGDFIESLTGEANAYSEAELTIVGRFVDCEVMKGNDVVDKETGEKTGDYYREYKWTAFDEEQQEVARPALPSA